VYIPLDSGEAGMGQRFLQTYKDIDKLREAWIAAIGSKDWALAAMYQLDLDKRRDQMILYAVEQAQGRIINVIGICAVFVIVAVIAFIRLTRA
jgi:hypothetical protein